MATFDDIGTPLTLIDLPTEIHLDIIARLPYHAKLCLRMTNSYFKCLVPPFSHDDLLIAEREEHAVAHKLLTCMFCRHLLHKDKFGAHMRQRKKRRGGSKSHERFCVEWELTTNRWELKECWDCRKSRIDKKRIEDEDQEDSDLSTTEIWGSDQTCYGDSNYSWSDHDAIWWIKEDEM